MIMFRKPSECNGAPRIKNKYISRYGMNNDPRFIETYERFAHEARVNRIQQSKQIIIVEVKNLDVRADKMYGLFKICGPITSHQLHLSEGGNRKHGFVVYQFISEARKAINKFHGMTFKRKTLSVSLAQSREERRECLEHIVEQSKEKNNRTKDKSLLREIQFIPGLKAVEDMTMISIKLDKVASDDVISIKFAKQLGYNILGECDPSDEVICNGFPMLKRGVTLVWV